MKKMILLIIIIVGAIIIKIPKYVELNDLAIIKDIAVDYRDKKYYLYLKEIIPKKEENGINYEYKYYCESADNLQDAFISIKNGTSKKLYLKKIDSLITNIYNTSEIRKVLKINPQTIIHTQNSLKKLKKRT